MDYNARYYSQVSGRFISPDTIVPNPLKSQAFNRYGYANNNPVRFTDPSGHDGPDVVNSFLQGFAYEVTANNWDALLVPPTASVRQSAEALAVSETDNVAFQSGRLLGAVGNVVQGVLQINVGGGLTGIGGGESITGVGAVAGIPKMAAGVALMGHGVMIAGQGAWGVGEATGNIVNAIMGPGGGGTTPPRDFASPALRSRHFRDHGADFGARTEQEYVDKANAFFDAPVGGDILEGVRTTNGDIVRFNNATQEFGVTRSDGTIRTYYKPDPAIHGRPTNLDYFYDQF